MFIKFALLILFIDILLLLKGLRD